MIKNQIHVFKQNDKWIVKKLGSSRILEECRTKHEAIGMAVFHAKRDGNTEVMVMGDINEN